MPTCGSLRTKASIAPRSCQALTLHHASFASASASAPRLPSDFCACSIAATASVKNSSTSAGSFSRSRVTTMTAIKFSQGGSGAADLAAPLLVRVLYRGVPECLDRRVDQFVIARQLCFDGPGPLVGEYLD